MNEERDCEAGLAHKSHGWSQGTKHYTCQGRTETTGMTKEPLEVIDRAINEAHEHDANGIEVSFWVLKALDQSGYRIVRKW